MLYHVTDNHISYNHTHIKMKRNIYDFPEKNLLCSCVVIMMINVKMATIIGSF